MLQLHQELRRSFQSVKENQTVWRGELDDCTALVNSLGNLAEQLRALKSVDISNTPLSSFPNLQERLLHKLLNAVDSVLRQFSQKVDALRSVRDSVCKQVAAVFQMYEQNSDLLPIRTCVERRADSPSISEMLEWLQDTERYYRIQYIQRKNLLEMMTPDDLTVIATAPKRWTALDSPGGEERISDVLLQVSLFMQSD